MAYTPAFRREALPHRSSTIAKDGIVSTPLTPINSTSSSRPDLVMVFTGQGVQWPLIGRELLRTNPVFQACVRSLEDHPKAVSGEDLVCYSIEEGLLKAGRKSQVSVATSSQPLCIAVQVALVDTMKSLSITPTAVIGHSSGEIAAAYAAGGLSVREAIIIAHFRGEAASRQHCAGTMAAIGLSWAETEKYLLPGTTMACDNSPNSVTVLGDADAVREVVAEIKETLPDILARLLQVDKAYHSDHMVEVGGLYLASLTRDGVSGPQTSTAHFTSSVTGESGNGSIDLGPAY